MELSLLAVGILSCIVFVLTALIGYLFFNQNRLDQRLHSMAGVVAKYFMPAPVAEETDDRVSVKDEDEGGPEVVEGPHEIAEGNVDCFKEVENKAKSAAGIEIVKADAVDTDDYEEKKTSELRTLLSQKGIPFGKRDSKPVLIQLLKAVS